MVAVLRMVTVLEKGEHPWVMTVIGKVRIVTVTGMVIVIGY